MQTKAKFKMRPLTNTEQILLLILFIAAFAFLINQFVLVPQAQKADALNMEKAELNTKISEMNALINKEEEIKKEWEELNARRNTVVANYFPTLEQSQIIYQLNETIPTYNLEVTDLSFNRPAQEDFNGIPVNSMEVNVPFNGTYEGVSNLLRAISMSPRRMMTSSLQVDRAQDNSLGGNASIKIYSLEGLAALDPNVISVQVADNITGTNPFASFEYFDSTVNANETSPVIGGTVGGPDTAPSDGDSGPAELKGDIVADFEQRNYDFIPSHSYVTGSARPSTIKASGRFSLRLEYNILGTEQENRAYADISRNKIDFNFPPEELKLMIYAFSYSPGEVGVRIITKNGDVMHIPVVNGVAQLGWGQASVELPRDVNLYPISLTHLYYGTPFDTDDFGVLIFDKLEAFYPHHYPKEDEPKQAESIFYKTQPGDTLFSISRKIYGTSGYVNEIMRMNDIKQGELLTTGKVLVLIKR